MSYVGKHSVPASNRFSASYVCEPNSGCWLWTGHWDKDGYGKIMVDGRRRRAHVYAYEAAHAVSVLPHTLICHRCDTPQCVNPAHLFIGTSADNTADMMRKGRHACGRWRAFKTHCDNGHPFDIANTHIDKVGKRHCRTCARMNALRRYHSRRTVEKKR